MTSDHVKLPGEGAGLLHADAQRFRARALAEGRNQKRERNGQPQRPDGFQGEFSRFALDLFWQRIEVTFLPIEILALLRLKSKRPESNARSSLRACERPCRPHPRGPATTGSFFASDTASPGSAPIHGVQAKPGYVGRDEIVVEVVTARPTSPAGFRCISRLPCNRQTLSHVAVATHGRWATLNSPGLDNFARILALQCVFRE